MSRDKDECKTRSRFDNGWEHTKELGHWDFGYTSLEQKRDNENLRVVKVCSRFDPLDGFYEEATIWMNVILARYRIIYLQDFKYVCGESLSLYFKYCRGGDRETLLHKLRKFSTEFRWHVFVNVAAPLAFLHVSVNSAPLRFTTWQDKIHDNL